MNKKLIAIIAVAAAILIIAVVAIVSVGNKADAPGKDMDVQAGVEDSIFDDEDAAGDKDSKDDKDGSGDSASNGGSNGSGDKDSQSGTVKPGGTMTYEAFHAMSPSKQQEYMESFKDIDAFFKWYNKAKKQYEKDHPSIEIDGGPVELE